MTTLDQLNASLIQFFNREPSSKLNSQKDLLESPLSDDWTGFINFREDHYHRERIYHHPQFDILILSWKKGQKTPIHDHPAQGCLFKVLMGELQEESYHRDSDGPIIHSQTEILQVNTVNYIEGTQRLHSIEALSDSVSLHIYSPGGYIPRIF